MSTKLIWLSFLLCPFLFAQEAQPTKEPQPKVTKIVRVQGDAQKLSNLLLGSPVMVHADDTLHAIVLNGTETNVAAAERTIHDLDNLNGRDLQNRNVELVTYVISGSNEVSSSSGKGPDLPALTPVYKQLRAVFPFKSYELLSTMLMRSGQNSRPAFLKGMMRSPNIHQPLLQPGHYALSIESISVSTGNLPVIHIKQFQFSALLPFAYKPLSDNSEQTVEGNANVQTDFDLQDGQKIVVGTSNVEPAGITLFLVVTAKVL